MTVEAVEATLPALSFRMNMRIQAERRRTDPSVPPLNMALHEKVLTHILAHPEEHRQGAWAVKDACGTAFCYAGHAVNMTMTDRDEFYWTSAFRRPDRGGQSSAESYFDAQQGRVLDISNSAMRQLGLTGYEGSLMFESSRTIDDLQWAYQLLADAEHYRLSKQETQQEQEVSE